MAVLPDADRFEVWAAAMRRGIHAAMLKTDLRAAINATDQWIEDNAVSFNAALPLPARTSLSASEKTALFCLVALKRAGFRVEGF